MTRHVHHVFAFWQGLISLESRPLIFVFISHQCKQLLSNQITGYYDPTMFHRMTAYRKKYGYEVTLLTLVEEWKHSVDTGKELVTILSTDMSKTFDSLRPALTIKKLEAYGLGISFVGFNAIFLLQES